MAKYVIRHGNGVIYTISAPSVRAAKSAATKSTSFDGGSVQLLDADSTPIAFRGFWRSPNHFGWDKWQSLNFGWGKRD